MKTTLTLLMFAMLTACGGGNDPGAAPPAPVVAAAPQPAVFPGLGALIPPPPRVGEQPICVITNTDGSKTTYRCPTPIGG